MRDEKYWESLLANTALNRFTAPTDITDTVSFLLNNNAITGQSITVDCGQSVKR